VTSDHPHTAGDLLQDAAERLGARTAIVELAAGRRREVGYDALDAGARRVAARLVEAGVGPGDPVALAAGNGCAVVQAWFGILYAGGVVVPVPTVAAPPEVSYRLDHARCAALLFDRDREPLAQRSVASAARAVPLLEIGGAAMILYTSGTTGTPKGAVISHASLVRHTRGIVARTLDLTSEDRVLGVLPLAHSYGCRMVMLASLVAGCRIVLPSHFDAAQSLQAMVDEEVSWAAAVPTMLAAWARLAPGPQPRSLRWCLSAGAPLAAEIVQRAEARLGAEVRQGFGMTEASFATINAPPDARVIGSVGRPTPGVEIKIEDEGGGTLPPGRDGQILVRGDNAMTGYLHDPAATAEALRGGWMHTGDIGRLDDAGRLWVVDRAKDMIIRGGNNVYPSEVEAVLAAHPDVLEVAVVGRPDAYLGEEIVAIVVPRDGAGLDGAELYAFAAERLSRTKVPREYAIVDALPLGPSRKVLKRTLREQLAAGSVEAIPVAAAGHAR
jgi:long-chain acyl-CoA synthetase